MMGLAKIITQKGGNVVYEYYYNSVLDAILQIFKTEGWRGLYKGCLPNYLKVAPSIAVSFVSYEIALKYL